MSRPMSATMPKSTCGFQNAQRTQTALSCSPLALELHELCTQTALTLVTQYSAVFTTLWHVDCASPSSCQCQCHYGYHFMPYHVVPCHVMSRQFQCQLAQQCHRHCQSRCQRRRQCERADCKILNEPKRRWTALHLRSNCMNSNLKLHPCCSNNIPLFSRRCDSLTSR